MILSVHIDERTRESLERVSAQTGRSIEDLAEAAVSEAALRAEQDHERYKQGVLSHGPD